MFVLPMPPALETLHLLLILVFKVIRRVMVVIVVVISLRWVSVVELNWRRASLAIHFRVKSLLLVSPCS